MITLQTLWPEGAGELLVSVSSLAIDSRQVQAGGLFFALQGTAQPERMAQFVQQAIARGAVLVLSESPVALDPPSPVPIYLVPDLRHQMGLISRRFLQAQQAVQPVRVAAVTGTNGKTTISRLLAELLVGAGQRCAVMGTTGNGIVPNLTPSTHTTLDALSLQQHLHEYAEQGARFACLEASSHGLEQGRLAGTPIEVAIFSNLTRDHLDYHGTLAAYAEAKSRLFAFPEVHTAIVNADDPASAAMIAAASASVRVWRYSMVADSQADFYVQQACYSLTGATLQVATPDGVVTLHSPLLGRFNVANLLAAVAGASALGVPMAHIVQAVPHLIGAAGRMQVIDDPSRLLVVDYAHTPDALTQVLSSLRPHVQGQLWVVFGCGGDRDRGKRPLMTAAALAHADQLILTADNPRSESVEAILADMQADLHASDHDHLWVEPDRRLAIRLAIAHAQAGDAVVLAGKGHEDYQEIAGVRHWFDDAIEMRQASIARPTVDTPDAMQATASATTGKTDADGRQCAADSSRPFSSSVTPDTP